MRNGNFALFIPQQGCPYQCIYCDQHAIVGQTEAPDFESRLRQAMPLWQKNKTVGQIAFFGGTFTGLCKEEMGKYLALAKPYLADGAVNGIRISTRPDCIDEDILSFLKENGVTHIELGVQSMDDAVLKASGRGYNAQTVCSSMELLHRYGFTAGMQMMPGLPGDTPEKSLETARKIISLGAAETRIYPTLVLKNTRLAELYKSGAYRPLTLQTAVELCARLKLMFEQAGVTVLKVGLHSGASEENILAGPFHPAFGQLVNSAICLKQMLAFCERHNLQDTVLPVLPRNYSVSDIVGQCGANRSYLAKHKIFLKILNEPLTNDGVCVIL